MLLSLLLAFPADPPPRAAAERVIFLGFDGADAKLVERYLEEGVLPNFARLRNEGTYARLGTTNPAQSPVSWAALNAGVNPGKTNLFDFVRRANTTASGKPLPAPRPELALADPIKVKTADFLPFDPAKPGTVAGFAGAALFALAFGAARLVRARARTAAIVALALGGVTAAATWKALDWIPEELPAASSPQKAKPFWAATDAAGLEFAGLVVPMCFPPERVEHGRLLCGLGVPDVRASVGDWFVYTTDETESFDGPPEGFKTETAGWIFKVSERGGRIESVLPGPANFWLEERAANEVRRLEARLAKVTDPDRRFDLEDAVLRAGQELKRARGARVTVPVSIALDRGEGHAAVTIDGTTQRIRAGEWSAFYRVTFALNPLLKLSALVRAKVVEWSESRFRLFVEPINFDPRGLPPQVSISSPRGYAAELADAIGDYETLGWACATNPVKDAAIDDQTFMEDIGLVLSARERMLDHELAKRDWRVLYLVFSEPDRVQHMLFRHIDPKNPLHDPAKAAAKLRAFGREFRADEAIRETCREMDRLVGRALAAADAGTAVLVASDHGFSSFRTGVNLNNWLLENGFLAVKAEGGAGTVVNVAGLVGQGAFLEYVDWSKTKAYSLGLGKIYLNVKGREPKGVVEPSEVESVATAIARGLESYRDPATGERVVRRCYTKEELYSGPWVGGSADLVLGFEEGYRVSWQSTLGGIELHRKEGERILVPNDQPWSGDHCSLDPSIVPGIFFANRKFALPDGGPDVLHLAPTVLALLGVPVPKEMDRSPLALR